MVPGETSTFLMEPLRFLVEPLKTKAPHPEG